MLATNENGKFIKKSEYIVVKVTKIKQKMGDVSPTNSTAEDEIVTFTVIRTSDAARKEVSTHYCLRMCVCVRVCAFLLLHFSSNLFIY